MPDQSDVADAVVKLRRFARVRDRVLEREPRTVTFTDDECLALVQYIDLLTGAIDDE